MQPYYADTHTTLYQGDCRELLHQLPAQSVHCVVTSPPYYGLRSYGTAPLIWDGDPECQHEWGVSIGVRKSGGTGRTGLQNDGRPQHLRDAAQIRVVASQSVQTTTGAVCQRCGAWQGHLGGEPTVARYVAHLVALFGQVWRVLRDDGTVFLNLGDSYYSNPGNGRGGERPAGGRPHRSGQDKTTCGLKPKDLVGIPWRVAFALQADGWYLRSDIIWHKPNPMPESVRDRPTKAHEYVFLLTKQARYFYDAEAVKEVCTKSVQTTRGPKLYTDGGYHRNGCGASTLGPGRLTGRNRRSVWTLATQPYKGAHFATMPPRLVEPCLLAGCPQGGTVLDPFAGAGTTLLVARHHGRHGLGLELNPDYCALAVERLRKAA